MAYEHLLRVDLGADGQDPWECTGLSEYRLGSGERIAIGRPRAPVRLHFVPTKMKRLAQKKYSPSLDRERMSAAQASASAVGTPLRTAASRVMSTRPAPNESAS